MSDDIVVRLENVSKKFCRSLRRSMWYGLHDIARDVLTIHTNGRKLRVQEFWAVDNVSFEIRRGETLGLIGANGSGKTTILKMLNGIILPDQGRVEVRGRVGALIAVGAGFHPQLTGRENIYINGTILGMSKREIDGKFKQIVEFADIGDFLDTPVKHYSSGMFVRLGFAVAVYCDPDILLVDEVLAVGDISFQAKCMARIKELLRRGVTTIFVSHNMNAVYLACRKCAYVQKGRIEEFGETRDIISKYKKYSLLNEKRGSGRDNPCRYGTQEVTIRRVEFLDQNDQPTNVFHTGDFFRMRIVYLAEKQAEDPRFVIDICAEDGTLISKPNTRDHGMAIPRIAGEGEINYVVPSLPLNSGRYFVSVGVWESSEFVAYDSHQRLYEFVVEDGTAGSRIRERFGLVRLPSEWTLGSYAQARNP